MSPPPPPRPRPRARTQLLVGYLPLLLVCAVVLGLLLLRVATARAALDRASATATATVVADGQPPGGRGVRVSIDAGGTTRTGVLELARPADVARGAQLGVRYDPRSPVDDTVVHARGDAADQRTQDLLFGVAVVVALLVVATVLTGLRLLSRPRLRRAPVAEVTATRFVARQGLLVRDWLELVTASGVRWLPVYWSAELARLAPGTQLAVHGRPDSGGLVLPVVEGSEVWPSGRVRARKPRGDLRQADPDPAPDGSWVRQVRGDAVGMIVAPLLGLLWSYVDGTGLGGFAVATVVVAAALFWLPQLLGSDPAPPARS